ncbi:MAG: hypothetical protein ACLTW9_30100 [Enterocloster sp.]
MDDKIKGILEEVQILFDCANQSSSLSRREAIIVGEAVAMPSRLKIKELREEQLPDSKRYKLRKRLAKKRNRSG